MCEPNMLNAKRDYLTEKFDPTLVRNSFLSLVDRPSTPQL